MSGRCLIGLWLLLAGVCVAAQTVPPPSAFTGAAVVTYPRAELPDDRRDDYPLALLTLALKKSGKPYDLRPSPVFMLQGRAISELEHGRTVDVIWTMTSAERESTLLPVRIPIDRGLLGWRLLLVRERSLPLFAALASAEDLKHMRAGLGFDWPDATILKHAGFKVDVSVRYGDIFLKLASERIDYFSRSVQEIWGELDAHRGAGFVVEPTLALRYPAAMYFFVNRRNTTLAADLQRGLDAALADGSFELLFQQHHATLLKKADFARRRMVELHNPLLPPDTPLGDRRLWFRLPPR